ncbi:MAG: MlaE family lipid ABC transporter permease subunit [Pseudomonadota bacterium]
MAAAPRPTLQWADGRRRLVAGGVWDLSTAGLLDARLPRIAAPEGGSPIAVDLAGIDRLDTAGAWLLERIRRRFAAGGRDVRFVRVPETLVDLIADVQKVDIDNMPPPFRRRPFLIFLNSAGEVIVNFYHESVQLLNFLGLVLITLGKVIVRPSKIRGASTVYHMEATGIRAMFIVGLLSFLIGVVLAYQGAQQLAEFGAQIFVVDLLGVSILRELGVLLTAIMVAGRSGSAFTAQIGTMMVNQEIDALETLGLDPIEVLVIPRVMALMVTMPLLVFFADIVGLFGGALVAAGALGIDFGAFMNRLQDAVELRTFFAGLIKAPVFAFVIGMVGCFQGMRVTGSAESVGRQTTQSVVQSIMLVLVLDAGFSVLFAQIGF